METVGELIYEALIHPEDKEILLGVLQQVERLTAEFPIYENLSYI
jgi:glycine/serine hydroxymethyltransferase